MTEILTSWGTIITGVSIACGIGIYEAKYVKVWLVNWLGRLLMDSLWTFWRRNQPLRMTCSIERW